MTSPLREGAQANSDGPAKDPNTTAFDERWIDRWSLDWHAVNRWLMAVNNSLYDTKLSAVELHTKNITRICTANESDSSKLHDVASKCAIRFTNAKLW